MKRAFAIVFLVFMAVGFIFATTWDTVDVEDDFGDLTGEKRLYTWIDAFKAENAVCVDYLKYLNSGKSPLEWDWEDCIIMISKGDSYHPCTPLFYVGSEYYDKWNIRIKLDDGTVNEYTGKFSGGFIVPENYVEAKNIISDLKKGCRIVIYLESKYSTYLYRLGYITLTDSDLSRL